MSIRTTKFHLLNGLGLLAFGAGAVWLGFEAGTRREAASKPTATNGYEPAVSHTPQRSTTDPATIHGVRPIASVSGPSPEQSIATNEASRAQPIPVAASPSNSAGSHSAVSPTAQTVAWLATSTEGAYLSSPAMFEPDAVLRQAEMRNRQGIALLARGAWFSARAELNEAIRLIASIGEGRSDGRSPSQSLSEAMVILTEAEDFVPRSSRLDPQADVSRIAAGHRMQVVTAEAAANLTPAAAREAYLDAAYQRLSSALGSQPAGSVAAHQLGKLYAALASTSATDVVDPRGKARVYYCAALAADPRNFFATNDLAVLLGEEGKLERSRQLLQASLQISPQPAVWKNLAAVHEKLGESELAYQARLEARTLEQTASTSGGRVIPENNVAWVSPRHFAATVQPAADAQRGRPSGTNATPPANGAAAGGTASSPIVSLWNRMRTPAPANGPVETASRPLRQPLAY